LRRLSGWLLRHKLLVLLAWLAVLVAGVVLAPVVTDRMSTDFSLPDQAGYRANLEIGREFGSGRHPTVPVVTLPQGTTVDSPGMREAIGRAFDGVAQRLGGRALSYATAGDRRFASADGRTTYGLVYPAVDAEYDSATVADLVRGPLPPDAVVRVTGIDELSSHEGVSAGSEVVALTLVGALGALVTLALVFGSVLAVVPLLVAAVAILAALLLVGVLTVVTPVNLIVLYLIALIGLGVAIDYSLLLVVRWREEQAAGHEGDEAVHRAMQSAGRAVVLSGSTVAVGLLSLVALPVQFLRGVGYAGLFIPLVSVLVTVTMLPVLLSAAGRRLDWPRRRRGVGSGRAWTAWARGVVRLRWLAVALSVAGLAVLGAFAFDLRAGQGQASSLAAEGPAHDGLVALTGAGIPSGVLTPVEVLVPSGQSDPAGLVGALAGVPGVWAAAAPDDPAWRRQSSALVEVLPAAEPGLDAGRDTVRRIRDAVAAGAPGAQVGGSGVQDADFAQAVYSRFPLMVVLISVVTLVLLTRALRSVLLAAKAVAVNLLSIGAVLGAIVLVWQRGYGAAALGGVGATGALDTFVPVFVFAFLFGLSMDYEVFLLTRMREFHDRGEGTASAVIKGVGHTGRLVTSAALVMFLAFASLAGAQDTTTKVFATGLGAGIVLDATVVRSLLVPALVALLGRWNWWLPPRVAALLRVPPSPARDAGPLPVSPPAVRDLG
jgi:putative drug exporter of the RND superfamily